jgi:hypothetical protein
VSQLGGFPITESSKLTSALVGATFVQPANVDYKGKKALMFVFAVCHRLFPPFNAYLMVFDAFRIQDLAVKIEGTFILRYRVFDIFAKAHGNHDLAVQAECYGGPFRVYSTKEFPGLQASTELTKVRTRVEPTASRYSASSNDLFQQLARYGVRLNIRETERRRRKKDTEDISPSPSYDGARHHRSGPSDSDEE